MPRPVRRMTDAERAEMHAKALAGVAEQRAETKRRRLEREAAEAERKAAARARHREIRRQREETILRQRRQQWERARPRRIEAARGHRCCVLRHGRTVEVRRHPTGTFVVAKVRESECGSRCRCIYCKLNAEPQAYSSGRGTRSIVSLHGEELHFDDSTLVARAPTRNRRLHATTIGRSAVVLQHERRCEDRRCVCSDCRVRRLAAWLYRHHRRRAGLLVSLSDDVLHVRPDRSEFRASLLGETVGTFNAHSMLVGVGCGCEDTGVTDCEDCPEGAPDAFDVAMSPPPDNGSCSDCAALASFTLTHDSDCTWSAVVDAGCSGPGVGFDLQPFSGSTWILSTGDVNWLCSDFNCLGENEFTLNAGPGGQCTNWPTTVTVSPAA